MPLARLELKNEYGLGNKKLFCGGDSKKDDPRNILGGISVAGLVGILRQLGDLAEFAANVFHDLEEQVAATSSRWEKISNKIQHMESALPTLEKAIQVQRSCIHFAYIPGYSWHANVLPDKNKLLMSRLPNFMVDLYEECRSPPQLHLLDKFDSSGHGACLKRYSDPSYFKKALASSEPIIFQKGRRKKKRRSRQGIGLQHPVCVSQCSNSMQYVPSNSGKLSFTSDVSFSDTMSSSEIARKSIQLESEMKSKNILEKSSIIPCLESDERNNTGRFKLERDHTNTFDFIVCTEPKHGIAFNTNLKPDWEGESLHSESEQKSSNTLEQFPLNSCSENARSDNISVIESESNASDHIICDVPKQDFADDDSKQHIIPNASFAASLETNLKPDWEGESLHSGSEQKASNTLEQFSLNSCLENGRSNNSSVIESSNASDHIICSEPKQDFADDDLQQHIILNASFAASLETNLKPDWEGEFLYSESEQKTSNTLEQFPLNSCLENAQSNKVSVIESESNASHHIICSEPKQDLADDDSQQRIIPNASFAASLETNLKPDWEGESIHSESEQKSSNTLEQFPLNSCFKNARSNNIGVTESDSNASDHIICSEPKQDFADDDSQQHIIPKASFIASLETNLKPYWEGESLHSESEQKSSNTIEQFPLNSCLENAQSNNISVIESESDASHHIICSELKQDFADDSYHIICSEPKQDFADDDSQQHIIPKASFIASLETNLKPDWEGESLHSESELKSSKTLEQFPVISCLESAQLNNTSPTESESNASDHIICSKPKQDIAEQTSSLSTSVVWYDESTEVEKPTRTSLYELEVFNEDLNLDSLQVFHPSNSLNESPHFKIDDEEDTMFELAMEMPSATSFENGAETNQGSNHSNITACDLETSLGKISSPNFDVSYNLQDRSTIPNTLDQNQSSLSGSFFNDNSNIIDQLSSKLSCESSIIDEQDLQTKSEDEKTKLQNHSSDNFNPPAVHIWTNGNILGLEPSKPPDFRVKADSEAHTIHSKKLVANSGLSTHSLFMNADFTKLQKIVHHNDATELYESETKENIKVGSCSPPLECMKFSFLPVDDLKKTPLNLEFCGSNVHEGYDNIKHCYHSFQLISELSIGVEDSGQESDDDTFCRSSMYSDDDVFSYRSKASEELWEEDDQSQFQKHRVSNSA